MKEESDALALRIYNEAAKLKVNGFPDDYIFEHLTSSGLRSEYAKWVVDSLNDFMVSDFYTRS